MAKMRTINGAHANIFDGMTEMHIDCVWHELSLRFGFNIKEWKKRFENEFSRQPHSVSKVSFFFRYGNEYLQPILNGILCRSPHHGTFNNFVAYVIRYRGL